MDTLITIITLSTTLMVLYHHLGYPLLLHWVGRKPLKMAITTHTTTRRYQSSIRDQQLPMITIIIPAYNEAAWISEKIRNLAVLDYPMERLQVILASDGCTDGTATIARQLLQEPLCHTLPLEIILFPKNRGKVAVLNEVIHLAKGELVALSDVSALLSIDALLIAANHFKNPKTGVLNGHYHLLNPGSEGERHYWAYQNRVQQRESSIGSALGAHGAFYIIRKALFKRLPADTINDDFILPMQIVKQGYRAAYDPTIRALELEQANLTADHQRRRRIAAGNFQQLLRLREILLPRYGATAFTFASGKGLRAIMPLLMILSLLGALLLAPESILFTLLASAQLSLYLLASYTLLTPNHSHHPLLQALAYLVSGHLAALRGTLQYLHGDYRHHWQKVTS